MATKRLTTEQDWIEAAFEAVGQGGVESIRVEPIAERLGVSKAGFYHRFRDREALVDRVVDYWLARAETHFERHARVEDPLLRLRLVGYDTLLDRPLRSADAWLLLHRLADDEHSEHHRLVREQTVDWARGILRELGFEATTAESRARWLHRGYLGLVADLEARTDDAGDEEVRALVDELIDLITARTPLAS